MVATGDDIAHITGLHGVVAVFVHQVEGILKMTLVVLRRTGGLVVHEDLHALGMGILIEHLDIEVGIRGDEVEDITLPHIRPVFPSDVPSLNKHFIETILRGEVDVAFHVRIIRFMSAIGCYLRPVYLIQMDRGEVIGIVPGTTSHDHLPPDTTVLRGMNPTGILQLTGLVEVQDQIR